MNLDLDASDLLYLAGLILAISSVVYFAQEIIADLSPHMKSALLLIAFPFLLSLGGLLHRRIISKVLYILSVFSYLVFIWYTIATFELGTNYIFLLLVVSSILFIGLGYFWERGFDIKIGKKEKKGILVVLLVLVVLLISFDVLGPQPSYNLDFEDSVDFEGAWEDEEDMLKIGEIEIENEFYLSRHVDLPDLRACSYTPEKNEEFLHYPARDIDLISGDSSKEVEVYLRLPRDIDKEPNGRPDYLEGISSLPIEEVSTCPEEGEVEEPKLVVATEGDHQPIPYR